MATLEELEARINQLPTEARVNELAQRVAAQGNKIDGQGTSLDDLTRTVAAQIAELGQLSPAMDKLMQLAERNAQVADNHSSKLMVLETHLPVIEQMDAQIKECSVTLKGMGERTSALEALVNSRPAEPIPQPSVVLQKLKEGWAWITTKGKAAAVYLAPSLIAVGLFWGLQKGCQFPNPNPPDPPPGPIDPVDPIPKPGPAPIPLAGLHVIIVYDKAYTAEQEAIIFGRGFREVLMAKCKDGQAGFRIYKAGVDASGEAGWIRDCIQKHPGQGSWMVISNPPRGYDGPIPANLDEAIKILSKVEG